MWRNLKREKINVGAVGIIGTFTRIIKRKKPFFTFFSCLFILFSSCFFYFEPFFLSSFTLISVILEGKKLYNGVGSVMGSQEGGLKGIFRGW
jgi:hypothetical protein